MLLKNRTETRQMDDNASQSSSSTSSLKAATSFVSSLSTKSWAVLSRKMKSATISKEGVSDKCDDITHATTTSASSNDHTISKNGSLKKTSSYGTSFNNNSASSSMDCSPQHQMVYKEIIIPNNNNNGYYDTASSVTLASSSSLTTASSGNLMDSSNTLPSRMEVEEKIPSQKTESGFHSSTNSQSTSVSSKDVSSSKSSDTKTSTASSTSSTASSQGDVNGRVESLVNKVLSPEAITVINLISTKFDALSRTNTIEGALSQDINNTSYNKTLMFSGRKEPSVTLNAFLLRLVTLLNWVFDKNSENGKGLNSTGMRYLVISTLYIERAMNMHPDLKITPLNIHRIFLGATVNAMTFFEDQIPDKTIMAKIGGVDEKQVRILGKRFFQFLDYRLWIEPSDYILYYKRICETVQISFEPEIPSWQL